MSTPDNPHARGKSETTAVQAVESVLASHPFLRGLQPAHLRLLADNAMRMYYEPNELIFCEDEPANRFYLIESGRIALESYRRDQASVHIQTIGPGDVLGWSWIFPPHYWNFDARALEATTTIFFYGTRLREQCEQDPALGYELMKRMGGVLVQRLQATRKQLMAASR